MKEPYAFDAVLRMAEDADVASPGGAITVALCGSWDHEPPCPLAPHHTAAKWVEGEVRLRTLFAAEPADVQEVERRIRCALSKSAEWAFLSGGLSEIRAGEAGHAARLVRN